MDQLLRLSIDAVSPRTFRRILKKEKGNLICGTLTLYEVRKALENKIVEEEGNAAIGLKRISINFLMIQESHHTKMKKSTREVD